MCFLHLIMYRCLTIIHSRSNLEPHKLLFLEVLFHPVIVVLLKHDKSYKRKHVLTTLDLET